MRNNFYLMTNVIFPIITSLFLFIYFLYFKLTKPVKTKSYNYFSIFLISFSIFLFGRPIQILSGPHPIPLIINNIRLIILCSNTTPMIILFTYSIGNVLSKIKKQLIILIGVIFGLIYSIFNVLGTKSSYKVFSHGNLIAYDTLTLPLQKPFYGREITILVQVLVGIILVLISIHLLIKIKKQGWIDYFKNKLFRISIGIFIFGSTLSVGSIVKQWWLYYSGAVFSTILIGSGILIDIKDLESKFQKLLPFLRDTFLQDISYSQTLNSDIFTTLKLLEKNCCLDTFIVLKVYFKVNINNYRQSKAEAINSILKIIMKILEEKLGIENFLLLQLSHTSIGIALSLNCLLKEKLKNIYDLAEEIREKILKNNLCCLSIGIGRTYNKLEELRQSYIEALKAQVYAEKKGYNNIVHINDSENTIDIEKKYPVKEKDELISAIKLGNINEVDELFDVFYEKLLLFTGNNTSMLRIRFLDFYSCLINISISNYNQIENLYELDSTFFSHYQIFNNLNKIKVFFKKIIFDITIIISKAVIKEDINITQKAKTYIENNYNFPLTAQKVAKNIFISLSHFLHVFKKQTDYTFVEYLTKVRLDKAKKLLLNSNLNITEIAYNVGFNDSNYFSTVFKNSMHITPKEYRTKNRNN